MPCLASRPVRRGVRDAMLRGTSARRIIGCIPQQPSTQVHHAVRTGYRAAWIRYRVYQVGYDAASHGTMA